MIAGTIGSVIIAGLMALLYILFNRQAPTTITASSNYGSNSYFVAPTTQGLVKALYLLDEFQSQTSGASAVFVLGGYRESPTANPTGGAAAPLRAGYVFPAASGVNQAEINISAAAVPQTATDFRAVLSSRPGVLFESSYDPADFTVITMAGLVEVTSVTQVRRTTVLSDGQSVSLYEVVLDKNLTAARDAVDGSPTQNRFAYRMALPTAEDLWTIKPGALHYWFRWDATWDRREEGPALLVFPDPFLMAGDQKTGDTKPFSRFLFFLSPNT